MIAVARDEMQSNFSATVLFFFIFVLDVGILLVATSVPIPTY